MTSQTTASNPGTRFTPLNPDFEARVRDSFARQPFMAFCGVRLVTVQPGFVEMRVEHRHDLTQQHGFLHGGLVGTMADNGGGYAAFSLMRAEDSVVTVEYKINFLSPAEGEELVARSRVVRAGGSLMVCQSDIGMLKNGTEKPCATALCTLMVLKDLTDGPRT